ncbi:MAG: amino acid synthesis family protein [Paracoccaceae bacterium]
MAALGGCEGIDAYGKGAIVGRGQARPVWRSGTMPGGYAMRELLGESRAIDALGDETRGDGATLDVPLGHINAVYGRSHFDAITVSLPDNSRADEILFVPAMAVGGRVHSRMGDSRHGWPAAKMACDEPIRDWCHSGWRGFTAAAAHG